MKNILRILIVAFLFSACSSGGDKFVGKWSPIGKGGKIGVMVIEKRGKVYDMYNTEKPDRVMSLDYDEDHDRLSMDLGETFMDIRYLENEHIVMSPRLPRGFDQPIELQKVEE